VRDILVHVEKKRGKKVRRTVKTVMDLRAGDRARSAGSERGDDAKTRASRCESSGNQTGTQRGVFRTDDICTASRGTLCSPSPKVQQKGGAL
jgi:hypothetical protein